MRSYGARVAKKKYFSYGFYGYLYKVYTIWERDIDLYQWNNVLYFQNDFKSTHISIAVHEI